MKTAKAFAIAVIIASLIGFAALFSGCAADGSFDARGAAALIDSGSAAYHRANYPAYYPPPQPILP